VINRYLFNKMCLVDISAITKLKKRIAPELIDETDIESMQVAGNAGMLFRSFGQLVRRLARHLFTRREN